MAQIKTGTVNVTNGSKVITSAGGADWSQVTIGSIFMVRGREALYTIATTPVFTSNRWECDLNVIYAENSGTQLPYTICRDFTPNYSLPLLYFGDVDTASYYRRAMSIIDQNLRAIGDLPLTFEQVGHNFQIGSCLRLNLSGGVVSFVLASADSEANSNIIGVVHWVSGSQFKLRHQGYITGLSGLTPGSVYYLSSSASPNNLTTSTGATFLKVPVLYADTATSGYLLSLNNGAIRPMAGATVGANGSAGAVPPPLISDRLKFLRGDGTWQDAIAGNSLLFGNLATSPSFNTAKWGTIAGTDSIYNALLNLNDRIKLLKFVSIRKGEIITESGVQSLGTQTSFTLTVPEGATKMRLRFAGGGGGGYSTITSGAPGSGMWLISSGFTLGGNGLYVEHLIPVSAGKTFSVVVGEGGGGSYSAAPSFTAFNGSPTVVSSPTNQLNFNISAGGGGAAASATPGSSGSLSPAGVAPMVVSPNPAAGVGDASGLGGGFGAKVGDNYPALNGKNGFCIVEYF